jgi:nicotinamide-nucleotide amidase
MEQHPDARVGETALSPERTSDPARARKEGAHGGTIGSPIQRPRAAIVVTGSELVRGERTDLNGPFLAGQALSLGLEPARITIVGDRPDELEAALREGLEADVCLITGGLGPTHDDRTVELVAKVTGRSLVLDEELEAEIGAVSRAVAERLRRPYSDFEHGVRKQATLPAGAVSLGLAGTAPGLVLEVGRAVVVVLPGPPAELQRLWPRALETEPVRRVLEQARPPGRRVLRFFGASESAVAKALADAGGDGDGVEATICARDFEIHVDLLVDPGAEARADEVERGLADPLERYLFARDERGVEELVLGLCRARGWTLATAESCTGGLVAARLTSVPGASEVVVGGIVAYADEVKVAELGVPTDVLEHHGAVSAETAAAMATGVRARLRADVGVAVTGVAGPGGGTPEKPVGLVHLYAKTPEADGALEFSFPADRESIRRRAAVAALHLVRRLLTQSRDEDV